MKSLLMNIHWEIRKVQMNKMKWKRWYVSANSVLNKKWEQLKSKELVKTIEKYNNDNYYRNNGILKNGYNVFRNNIQKYSFDEINKVVKLYSVSQLKDEEFNNVIFNYIIKKIDALPLPITVNIFHNLVKSGLGDSGKVYILKEHFIKNIDKFNSLDMTIIFSSFTMLQEQLLGSSSEQLKTDICNEKTEVTSHLKYNDVFAIILQKIKEEERVHNDLSVVNAVLLLNMMSRINLCNYEIFKFFTNKYFKVLKEKDLEPHHYTLLLNSFAKCNIHINILKYIIKHMNNDNFINALSYINIMNALHYMAKFNYKNKYFVQNLKRKVESTMDQIPQRELSNIVWALSKLKHYDVSFNYSLFQKMEKIIHTFDPMSIAQVLDALRRNKNGYNNKKHEGSGTVHNISQCEFQNKEKNNVDGETIHSDVCNHSSKTKLPSEIQETIILKNGSYDEKEKHIIHLLTTKYLEYIDKCSLHVLTQVPFCCLQLDCENSEIYRKSLEVLKKKRKQMSTLNLIYAKYFIRIYIEKRENCFQKLPRHIKQFAKEILTSDDIS